MTGGRVGYDVVFGNLAYSERTGWDGTYTYPLFGRDLTVSLSLDGWDEDPPFDKIQKDAMQRFNQRKAELCAQADEALYRHYLEQLDELRDQFGDSADKLMPIVANKDGLNQLVTPTCFLVRRQFPSTGDDRIIGLMYECTWEEELGLAVKFVNETIVEVGGQYIVA
ncbi:hypothetical protein A5717_15970 [Mycolicibacterium porcinum]|uniref:DUF6985 domain-containing protein n=1 Tax=Mycolicibacterium porcinum TaxID=39693 RepID=UPI00080B3F7D|nr:hypothetical protein [Mycolicibacterium porcinum]OCB12739.1 hypothetical protein A5717_15970 [Mycolicibacterium porcinum]